MNNKLLTVLRKILGLVGLLFILYILRNNLEKVVEISSKSQPSLWITTILAALTANILLGRVYSRLLIRTSPSLDINTGTKIYLLTQVAKYIPGKIWPYILQVSHLPNGTKFNSILTPNIDLLIMSLIGITSFGCSLIIYSLQYYLIGSLLILIGIFGTALTSIGKHWARIRSLLKKNIIPNQEYNHSDTILLNIEFWSAIFLAGLAQFFLLKTLLALNTNTTLQLLGISLLSWVIGVIAFFFPAGIGIREWSFIQGAGLITVISEIASAAAIITRLWWMAIDIAGGILAMGWNLIKR